MTSPTPGSPTPTADPATLHVVVGPDEHGVVLHGELVGHACGDWVLRLPAPRPLTDDELGTARVVHVPWTDRLFGRRAEQALAAFAALTEPVLQRGLSLSVTLHDLPVGDSALEQRRRTAYRGVVAHATGVVVSSWRELELAQELSVTARSLRCIPLPVPSSMTDAVEDATRRADATAGDRPSDVTVLGFVFPDRGYEHTIAELPTGVDLVALGRPSEGHDDLPEQLAELAARTGHLMRTTGFVADADLPGALRAAGVPVAPNRRVAASGSIAAWVGAGRRPLVPDTAYARELAARWPGALRLYDADAPGALRREIEATVVDPSLTWLPPGTRTGPDTREVARAYATHLAACLPPAALPLGGDRWVVPDNRWDLLDGRRPDTAPTVSVVVPHHEAQADLDLVLTALTLQDHPATRLQVVVADDGSRVLPDTRAAGGLDVRVVRQQRAGFRAAAARNLGAAAAEGHVVAFLDGDTVPEPGYLRALTRLPALLPDALTVGRRRHADLGGWSPARLRAWLTRGGPPPRELTEPTWLRDGYREHRDLLDVDSRSHRYVISAVMALHRDLLTELGGFDERFSSYGGEDWQLAHRAYAAGAVLAHVPAAVAWHDGPEWGERVSDPAAAREVKNLETLALAALLPDPKARGGGQWDRPALVVVLGFADPVEVLATSRAALSGDTDAGIWVDHPDAAGTVALLGDRRVTAGVPPPDVLAGALAVLYLDAPARVTGLSELVELTAAHGVVGLPTGRLESSRSTRRTRRWAARLGQDEPVLSARLFGAVDRAAPRPSRPVDLAHELAALRRGAGSMRR
ncbi:glycosyltransferase [Dermatophilaceae bacterium Soc4.6]